MPGSKVFVFLFFLMFSIAGCASPFSVTLIRVGGFSGLEERYMVDQDGHGTRTVKMPADSQSNMFDYQINEALTRQIAGLLHNHWSDFLNHNLNGTGNITTGLRIDYQHLQKDLTWPNSDPPVLSSPVIDSLYHLMLSAEQQMIRK